MSLKKVKMQIKIRDIEEQLDRLVDFINVQFIIATNLMEVKEV